MQILVWAVIGWTTLLTIELIVGHSSATWFGCGFLVATIFSFWENVCKRSVSIPPDKQEIK